MLWSPALRFAAAKVLEEMMASTGELALGMVTVVAAEVRAPEVQLHLIRGSRSTVVMGVSLPQSRPQEKCYSGNQLGHRHNERTATIKLNPSWTFHQGNTAIIAPPPLLPSAADPPASVSTMAPTYSPSPSGGQQYTQQCMACLGPSGVYGLTGQAFFLHTVDGCEVRISGSVSTMHMVADGTGTYLLTISAPDQERAPHCSR